MLITEKKIIYKAFGFSIISEFPLPELTTCGALVDSIDIEIKIENITQLYFELVEKQNSFVIQENLVMFQVPELATFSIQDGKTITVSPLKVDADEDMIRLYILGTCMGAILMQRKIFPLHGSAIAINGKAYAIIGESGAGKSTLASAFLNKGYQLLSDDVIAISSTQIDNIPFVTPSYPQQKLWRDSLINFGMETSQYRSIFGRENKYCVPVSSNYCTETLPLAGVFELTKSENKNIEISSVNKLDRFPTLFHHTYRNFIIRRLSLMEWHFHTSANIIEKIDMYKLQRPVTNFNAAELVTVILDTINKGE